MKRDSWINKNFCEYLYIEKIDGERTYLEEDENLLMSVDSVMIQGLDGRRAVFPAVQIAAFYYKLKG